MLLPRIAARQEIAAGYISLAGSARPLEDLVLDQSTYILSQNGLTEAEQRQLEELKVQVNLVKSDKLTPATSAKELPLGIPADYWLDLRDYRPAEAAKAISKPLLILQGERDYQVTMDDYQRFKTALVGREHVTFHSYPALNHLFMHGEGKSRPAEYSEPGNVAEEVVADVANWVHDQKSGAR
jgi:fermentation-respiration switch protein FrsA (DUF1100 family)